MYYPVQLTICTTLYNIIVTLISLLLRLFCVKNTKYISYLCILYYISSDECISKEGRYVESVATTLSDNSVCFHYCSPRKARTGSELSKNGARGAKVDFFMEPTINT